MFLANFLSKLMHMSMAKLKKQKVVVSQLFHYHAFKIFSEPSASMMMHILNNYDK